MFRRIFCSLWALLLHGMSFAQDEVPRYVKYATYLGGAGSDIAFDIAADSTGNIFLAGATSSPDFLAGVGLESLASHGDTDAVIVKLDPEGLEVLSAAVIGGPGADLAHALDVSPGGDVFVFGEVASGFTPPPSSCRETVGGSSDLFVARLDNGLEIEDLQLLGGSGEEGARDLHVSDDGTLSVVGYTASNDLETTAGALQATFQGGSYDCFVVRMRLGAELACGDRVRYSTYLGSRGSEADPWGAPFPGAIDVDPSGLVAVAGMTGDSETFPSTECSYRSPPGGTDVFVTQLRCDPELPSSEQLVYGALIGGTDWDGANGVEVTPQGRIRVTGITFSSSFPSTTAGGQSCGNDCFVLELDPRCELPPDEQLRFSTLIGGSSVDPPTLVLTRADGSLLIPGLTASSNFPLTADGLGQFAGVQQPYLCVLPPPGAGAGTAGPPFSTPLSTGAACGGLIIECDRVLGLALLPDQTLLACGTATGALFGVQRDALQPFSAGGPEMFLYRLDLRSPQARMAFEPASGVAPLTVCFDADVSTPSGTTLEFYAWDFGDGASAEGGQPCHEYERTGLYTVRLEVRNSLDLIASAEADVKVSCPSGDVVPWTAVDIGGVDFGGGSHREATERGDILAVCSAGDSFSGSKDAFHLVHQNPSGPARLEAVVESLDGGGTRRAAGVMWRESLDPSARFVALVVRGERSLRFLRREGLGGSVRSEEEGPSLAAPIRLRLDRQGSEFVVSAVSDTEAGASFQEVGRAVIEGALTMSPMGLAVTAGQVGISDPRVEVRFSDVALAPLGPGRFVRGDTNDDGKVDVADAVASLGHLFQGGAAPTCLAAADANDSGAVDLSDAVYTLDYLFLGSPAPPAPFPECGADPTEDALGCEGSAVCR